MVSKMTPIEKYNQAWLKFKTQIAFIRKKRFEIFSRILKKMDQQELEGLRNEIKNHE